jgi:hypothetical protein
MVKRTRIEFSLDEIKQIRIVCLECSAEVTKPLCRGKAESWLPERCPNCLAEWWDKFSRPAVVDATVGVMSAMNRLGKILQNDPEIFDVRFEIDGEEDKA